MKRIILILLSMMTLAGCSAGQREAADPDRFWAEYSGGDDDPIVFLPEIDPGAWKKLTGLEERFRACNVPDGILKEKTTRALGLSILHYPLNHIIFAYNYYDEPVRLVFRNSSLHAGLAARSDAAEVMTEIFGNTDIDLDLTVSTGYDTIALGDGFFLEFFLGSGLIEGLDKGNVKDRLKDAVKKKRDARLAARDAYGDLPLISLAYMNERLGLGVQFSADIVSNMHQFIEDN